MICIAYIALYIDENKIYKEKDMGAGKYKYSSAPMSFIEYRNCVSLYAEKNFRNGCLYMAVYEV